MAGAPRLFALNGSWQLEVVVIKSKIDELAMLALFRGYGAREMCSR